MVKKAAFAFKKKKGPPINDVRVSVLSLGVQKEAIGD